MGGMCAALEQMQMVEPAAAYWALGGYLRMIGDFMAAALQSRFTNVLTRMVAPDRWEIPYRFESISENPLGSHGLSHGAWGDEFGQMDQFHVRRFSFLVEKMDGILEADGTSLRSIGLARCACISEVASWKWIDRHLVRKVTSQEVPLRTQLL